jgi:hypothetical protein
MRAAFAAALLLLTATSAHATQVFAWQCAVNCAGGSPLAFELEFANDLALDGTTIAGADLQDATVRLTIAGGGGLVNSATGQTAWADIQSAHYDTLAQALVLSFASPHTLTFTSTYAVTGSGSDIAAWGISLPGIEPTLFGALAYCQQDCSVPLAPLQTTPVPEPLTLVLVTTGAGMAMGPRLRRRAAAASI